MVVVMVKMVVVGNEGGIDEEKECGIEGDVQESKIEGGREQRKLLDRLLGEEESRVRRWFCGHGVPL